MSYKVIIPTAGIGSRLKDLTKYLNKSLVSISNKPVITHIINQFPKDCEFVIPLGYHGRLVKEYLKIAHPNQKFIFVNIKPFEGRGSGLGYTILSCKKFLMEPFVFSSCDTLVKNKIPTPNNNWIGYADIKNTSSFRTIETYKHKVVKLNEKNNNFNKFSKPYIGLSGIKDFQEFWSNFSKSKKLSINQGEAYGLRSILNHHKKIIPYKFNWFDTGTLDNLKKTRIEYSKKNQPNILEKPGEAIWFVDDKVIKFSKDKKFIKDRVKRVNYLKSYVPKIITSTDNMYTYKKVEGKILSKNISKQSFESFLSFSKKFWKKVELSKLEKNQFEKKCYKFYHDKTLKRIDQFFNNFSIKDDNQNINKKKMESIYSMLKTVDWIDLSKGYPTRFHGDYHFENILKLKKNKFILLDWRQNFEGNIQYGDMYYDLAKLLHGLIVSYDSIVKNKFKIYWSEKKINFKIYRNPELIKCEQLFYTWCKSNFFSVKKIKILTALIFLNICPLHHYPYSLFLYALGKYMLKENLT